MCMCKTGWFVQDSWVEPYTSNIGIKYVEVETLLFRDGGMLTGGSFKTRTGDGKEVRRLARELLCMWGSCATAEDFIAQLFLVPVTSPPTYTTSKGGGAILPEFSKHIALVG